MSLYELLSMFNEMDKQNKKHSGHREVSDEEWDQAAELLASVTLNDPNVRVH